jgi:lysozyme
MKCSQKGRDLIKEVEGLRLTAYADTGGVLTIGYGHVLEKGEPHTIKEAKANFYLEGDILKAEKLVNRYILKGKTNQDQYDAFVSFAYNLGRQGFVNKDGSFTGIRKKHNAGLWDDVPDEFRKWKYDNGRVIQGLQNRREKEIALYRGER